MAMKTEEYQSRLDAIYPRLYVDHGRKLYCKTSVEARVDNKLQISGSPEVLELLAKDLSTMGYQLASRRAFEVLTAE